MANTTVDFTGRRVGQCVVIGKADRKPHHYAQFWVLRCDCGNICEKAQQQVRKPSPTTQCSECFAKSVSRRNRKHGETGNYLFRAWDNMRRRCHDPSYRGAQNYAGRGISVYEPWRKDYVAFATWVRQNIGERPTEKHSLDRRNNDGNYVPGNLRWATPLQQSLNRRPYKRRYSEAVKAAGKPTSPTFVGPRRRGSPRPKPQI